MYGATFYLIKTEDLHLHNVKQNKSTIIDTFP